MQAGGAAPSSAPSGVEVPLDLLYRLKPSDNQLLRATRYDRIFTSESPTTNTPSLNVIRINVVSSNFMDLKEGRLSFDFKAGTSTSNLGNQFDGGAHCIIKRLRILNREGAEIERCESYNLYHTILQQYQDSLKDALQDSINNGCPDGMNVGTVQTITSTVDSNVHATAGAGVIYPRTRYRQEDSTILKDNVVRRFEFKLKNGWFNPVGGKYLPPDIMWTLELTLDATVACMVGATTTADYSISNVTLKIPVINIVDPGFSSVVEDLRMAPHSWRFNSYKLYQAANASTGAAASSSVTISDRSMSLNAFLCVSRLKADLSLITAWPLSKRSVQAITSWQFTIGSEQFPPQAVPAFSDTTTAGTAAWAAATTSVNYPIASSATVNIASTLNEVLRVFPNMSVIDGHSFCESSNNNGTGLLALNLKAHLSSTSSLGGMDTKRNAVPITFTWGQNAISAERQWDFFALCDVMVDVMPPNSYGMGGLMQASS